MTRAKGKYRGKRRQDISKKTDRGRGRGRKVIQEAKENRVMVRRRMGEEEREGAGESKVSKRDKRRQDTSKKTARTRTRARGKCRGQKKTGQWQANRSRKRTREKGKKTGKISYLTIEDTN